MNRFNSIGLLIIFLLIYHGPLFSKEADEGSPCKRKIFIPGTSEILRFSDCALPMPFVSDKEVDSRHREAVNKKFADMIAGQISESIEESLLVAQAYQQNGKSLLAKGSSNGIVEQCNLGAIDNIVNDCQKKMNDGDDFKNKIESLTNSLRAKVKPTCIFSKDKINTAPISDLLGIEALGVLGGNKRAEDECLKRQNPNGEERACPAQNSNIASQLTSQSASELIEDIIRIQKMAVTSSEANSNEINTEINKILMVYPTLRLIVMAGGDFKKGFINYLQAYKKDSGQSAKEYINDFIFKNKSNDLPNKDVLSKALEGQCGSLLKNIKKFLCSKPLHGPELAALEPEATEKLFGLKLNKKDGHFEADSRANKKTSYDAYGFYCLAESEKARGVDLNRENSVDSYFKELAKSTRPEAVNQSTIKGLNQKFCAIFNCKDQKVQSKKECSGGGPLSADNLRAIYECPAGKKCTDDILKYVSFLDNYKITRDIQEGHAAKMSRSDDGNSGGGKSLATSGVIAGFDPFIQVYLGAKNTVIAEGRVPSKEAVAEKAKEQQVILAEQPKTLTAPSEQPKTFVSKISDSGATSPIVQSQLVSNARAELEGFVRSVSGTGSEKMNKVASSNVRNRKLSGKESAFDDLKKKLKEKEKNLIEQQEKLDEDTRAFAEQATTQNNNPTADINKQMSNLSPTGTGNKGSTPRPVNGTSNPIIWPVNQNLNLPSPGVGVTPVAPVSTAVGNGQEGDSKSVTKANGPVNGSGNSGSGTSSGGKSSVGGGSGIRSAGKGGVGNKNISDVNSKGKPAEKGKEADDDSISSEELKTLTSESLEKFKTNNNGDYILKIKYKNTIFKVPFSAIEDETKKDKPVILLPALMGLPHDLYDLVLNSPIFKDYKEYEQDLQDKIKQKQKK